MRTRDIKHVEGNRPIPSWGFVFTSIAALMLCLATSRGRQQVETNARTSKCPSRRFVPVACDRI